MRAHLVQFEIAWEDRLENFRRVRSLVSSATVEKHDLILLPEMFDSGFSLNIEKTADNALSGEKKKGPTLRFLRELAGELGVVIQGSLTVVGADGKGRNLATIIGPDGGLIAEYAKVHPFSYGREPEKFVGGDRVVTYTWMRGEGEPVNGTDQVKGLTVCPAVCYDLRFPELFRRGLQMGAELYAIGANWPAARAAHWRALLIARAIENQAFVLGVNRTGSDPNLTYSGGSIAVGPKGEVLGELGDRPGVLSVEIDPAAVREWRGVFPAWKDARLAFNPSEKP